MDHSARNKLVSFIWSIADDCLRDVFVREKYRDVILSMLVLRRIHYLREDAKAAVLKEARFQKEKAKHQIESQIQTLQTLRSTLIAHAVTGKIKV